MSCTVVAVPTLIAINLAHLIGAAVAAGAVSGFVTAQNRKNEHILNDAALNAENGFNEEVQHIRICDIVEKEFQTAYMGKEILLKTLQEHGVSEINEDVNGDITGSIGSFTLKFERNDVNKPYVLKISCNETDNAEAKLEDLNSEYALNVQEDAYLNLVENLKKNNMEIEDETVEDDNTIVLTINLE